MTRQFKDDLLNNTIADRMANGTGQRYEGLKVFSMAYRDISIDELEKIEK